MTLHRGSVKKAAIGVAIAEMPQGLSTMHRADCAGAIWKRKPLTAFQAWLDDATPSQLSVARVVFRPAVLSKDV